MKEKLDNFFHGKTYYYASPFEWFLTNNLATVGSVASGVVIGLCLRTLIKR